MRASSPWGTGAKRLTGAQKKGLQYEAKVGKALHGAALGHVVSGQWFEGEDADGIFSFQPDHYVILPDKVLLFEAKLSFRPTANDKISLFYRPLLEFLYGCPVTACQVFRNAWEKIPAPRTSGPEELCSIRSEKVFHWHFLA